MVGVRDTAWVIIECGDLQLRARCSRSWPAVWHLTRGAVLLPYRVRSVPRHYEVSSVTKGLVSNSTVAYLTRNDYPEGLLQISIRYPASLPMYGVNYSSSVLRYANGRHAAVCRPFGDSHICVRGDLSSPGSINIAGSAAHWMSLIGSPPTSSLPQRYRSRWLVRRPGGLAFLSLTDQGQRRRPKAITATRPMMKMTPSVVPSTPCPLAIRYTHAARNARVITTP